MREIKTKATQRGNIIFSPQSHQNMVAGFNKVANQVSKTSVATPLKNAGSFAFNRGGAALLGTLMLPFFIPATIATGLTLGKDIIYKDKRSGPDGEFDVLKLRTMKHRKLGQTRYEDDDKRLTKLGTLFRKLRIDEVPQLFYNIFWKGNMNLVGPRPQPIDEYKVPKKYAELTKYTPGLFTPKQLAPPDIVRSTPEQERFEERYAEGCRIELEYMKNKRLFSDTGIILRVSYKMLFNRGAMKANPDKKSTSIANIGRGNSEPIAKNPPQTQQPSQNNHIA